MLKVRNRVLVGNILVSFFTVTYTLFLQFRPDFHLRHAGQVTAADDIQRFVDGDTYWSINKSSGLAIS